MSNDVCEAFGRRLRTLRQRRGWSQEEFAHRVGLNVSYLSEVETGKAEPCLRKIKEMAQGFEISLSELMRRL